MKKSYKTGLKAALSAMLAAVMLASFACSNPKTGIETDNPTLHTPGAQTKMYSNISTPASRDKGTAKQPDATFSITHAGFMTELFKNSVKSDENSLVSPISVLAALAMTANGAKGNTLHEMIKTLSEGMDIDEMNKYLSFYLDSLEGDKSAGINIANSSWFRQNEVCFLPNADGDPTFTVNDDFLRKNACYYGADVFEATFDDSTVQAINSWTKEKTNGMIDGIIDEIDPLSVMQILNALTFDAEWSRKYEREDQLSDGEFTASNGQKRDVKFMRSTENIYLETNNASGFMKPYKGGRFAFAALLPNAGVDIYDLIEGLNGETLLSTIKNARECTVYASLPKFAFDCELSLKTALKAMGMEDAFDGTRADFSGLGKSEYGNIKIAEVLHKTHIEVGEQGTKAAAVTRVEMMPESAPVEEPRTVILDRPFVFMIIDTETNLPLFMGCAADIGE